MTVDNPASRQLRERSHETRRAGTIDMQVAPRTVRREAVEKIRGAIFQGLFKPGQKLVEANLCEMLGVSRASLREALRSLEAERLIVIPPNRGPHVAAVTWDDAEQIYQLRELLEGEAAALCAARITSAEIVRAASALSAFKQAVTDDDAEARIQATSDFYSVILQAGGNRVIEEVLGGLLARINFLRFRSMSEKGRAKRSFREMAAILAAIKRRDTEAARAAAREHVHKACRAAHSAFGHIHGR